MIYVPDEYLGPILKLCQDRRGIQKNLTYVGGRAQLTYELPLNEVVFDFYDRLKSITRGYAQLRLSSRSATAPGDLVKMSILVNNEPVDALSHDRSPLDCRDARPRHVRAAEGPDPAPPVQDPDPGGDRRQGGRARDDRGAAQGRDRQMRYGGDVTRKRKLLEKQKEGKKRMREYGTVQIPQEAFIAALRMGDMG